MENQTEWIFALRNGHTRGLDLVFPQLLASYSSQPVILASEDKARIVKEFTVESRSDRAADAILAAKGAIESYGYHVIEQRFPRRAYIVIREERKTEEPPPAFPSPGIPLPPLLLDEPKKSDPTQELRREEEY